MLAPVAVDAEKAAKNGPAENFTTNARAYPIQPVAIDDRELTRQGCHTMSIFQ
ncbi:MAG: hypothetical protein WBO88_13355 [Candidatus Dechloromonas phosphoritropha]